jgi:hypothetical protein
MEEYDVADCKYCKKQFPKDKRAANLHNKKVHIEKCKFIFSKNKTFQNIGQFFTGKIVRK